MRTLLTSLFVMLVVGPVEGRLEAGLMVYTSQTAFQSDAPGLTMQDFSAANVADNAHALAAGPLNNLTNDGIFSPGDIAVGLEIEADGSTQTDGNKIFVAGVGKFGNTVKAITTNGSDATMFLHFPAVSAVGLKFIGNTVEAAPRRFDVTVQTTGGTHTFQTDPIPISGDGVFYGMIATSGDLISRVEFWAGTGAVEGVTHVEFGNPVAPVPEPGSLLLYAFGIGGLAAIRRRGEPRSPRWHHPG